MFYINRKNTNEVFRFNDLSPIFRTEYKNVNEVSPFLIEQNNKKKRIYDKNLSKNNYENSSFKYKYNYMAKTQPKFYKKYRYYKSQQYLPKINHDDDNYQFQLFKEKEKQIRIIKQNYQENMKEELKKDIKTYNSRINLNISNYEILEPIDISRNKKINLKQYKSADKYDRKRNDCEKLFYDTASFNLYNDSISKKEYSTASKKYVNERESFSYDKNNISHPINQKSNEYTNIFNENRDKINVNKIKNKYNKNEVKAIIIDYKYIKKIKLFIKNLEEYFVQTLKIFFFFFIHKLKLYIKIASIRNKLESKENIYYTKNNNVIINQIKNNDGICTNKCCDNYCSNKNSLTNLKNTNIKNTPFPLNCKKNNKHIQFSEYSNKNEGMKKLNNIYIYSKIKDKSVFKTYQYLSTALNSNEITNTNSKSNYENYNLSDISSLINTKNIYFIKKRENSLLNNSLKNEDLTLRNLKNSLEYKSIIRNKNSFYKNIGDKIYIKPKIEFSKGFIISKKCNFQNNQISNENKYESSIKSIIIKKKSFDKTFKQPKQNDELKEIIIKNIHSYDKLININIKYITSEKIINDYTKLKIRRKLLNSKNIKNIFYNCGIDLLKPTKTESIEFVPLITVLKVNIKNNGSNNALYKNSERNEKLLIASNVLNNIIQKLFQFYGKCLFNELQKINYDKKLLKGNISENDKELNEINISCFSNKINENNKNGIGIGDNYSLNNEIDNILIDNNYEKIEEEKYLNEINYIDKMLSSENSENENIIRNTKNNKIIQRRNTTQIDSDCYNYQINEEIKNCNRNSQSNKLERFKKSSLGKHKLFRIKMEKIRKIIYSTNNKWNKEINCLDLLKYHFLTWKQNIQKLNFKDKIFNRNLLNNKTKKIKVGNIKSLNNLVIEPKKVKKEIIQLFNKNSVDNSRRKINKTEFEDRLKDFRLNLINYFVFRIKKLSFSDN